MSVAAADHPSGWSRVYLYDLGYCGVIEAIQALCTLSLIFSRYQLLYKEDSVWKTYLVAAYIFFFLLCPWLPFYTIVPIFVNSNSPNVVAVTNILYQTIYFPGVVLYHLYFTGSFVFAIRRLLRDNIRDGRLLLMARKSIIHSIIRCVAFRVNIGVNRNNPMNIHCLYSVAGEVLFLFNFPVGLC